MEFRVLRYFLTVAQEENISHAAELLHVTQPTLSRQLADLENELNVQLFIRGNRKITLTEQGVLFRRRAEEIISLMNKLENEMKQQNEIIQGTISFGSAESAAAEVLPKLIKSFSEKYPHVQYELFTGNADIIKERIDKGLIDIGLLTEPVEVIKYDYLRLKEKDRWGIITYCDSPLVQIENLHLDDLLNIPLAVPRRPEIQRNLANWFGRTYDNLHIFATYNLIGNAAKLVQQKLCSALALECIGNLYDIPGITFKPLYPELFTTSVLVWKKQQPSNNAVRKFIEETAMLISNS